MTKRTRTGGRKGNSRGASSAGSPAIKQLPWQSEIRSPFEPLKVVSDDQLEAIHEASMRLLEAHGIEVMSATALELFAKAGADVDHSNRMVRIDRDLLMDLIATAPSTFEIKSRNPERSLTMGGNHIHFGLVSGAPNCHDLINGRRAGNWEDYQKLIKLGQYFNIIHFFGNQTLAPTDLPANNRHLDTTRANLTLSDKVFLSQGIGATRAEDAIRLTAIAHGIAEDKIPEQTLAVTNINVNSPRKLDVEMAEGCMAMARLNQATVVTPFTLMGAMTPVTLAAAAVQQNAEALIGVALTQLVRPGAPVVYGAFTSNVDLKSGAPAFGTPENTKANIIGGQLARRYKLPQRTSACNASNVVDAQATWETQNALWSAVMAHGNMIMHAAGWLEGGLVASFEKLILDVEMLQAMSQTLQPPKIDEAEMGLSTLDEVAPGGHFFGCAHTMERYETAFYEPMLSDWQTSENWAAAGSKTATDRATDLWQQALNDYEAPALDPSIAEAMDAFVANRKQAIGDKEI